MKHWLCYPQYVLPSPQMQHATCNMQREATFCGMWQEESEEMIEVII